MAQITSSSDAVDMLLLRRGTVGTDNLGFGEGDFDTITIFDQDGVVDAFFSGSITGDFSLDGDQVTGTITDAELVINPNLGNTDFTRTVIEFSDINLDATDLNFLNGFGRLVDALTTGKDRFEGTDGDDSFEANSGRDRLYGEKGNDMLFGEDGRDRLFGGNGNDHLDGGNSKDILKGGKGRDILEGGRGQDTMTGGSKADIFVFSFSESARGERRDIITDFDDSEDMLNFGDFFGEADAMTNIGSAGFSGEGDAELRINSKGVVRIDENGDGLTDLSVKLLGVGVLEGNDWFSTESI